MNGVISPELLGYLRSGRVPHGFLFCGGAATYETAISLAAVYLCENGKDGRSCGVCGSCVKIEASSHPDVVFAKKVMPDGKYKVDDLRRLISDGYLRPNDDNLRVYIVEDLHEMSPACQNSLLKFIEEPPEFNRFIFTAETVSGILETIISRLVRVDFGAARDYESVSAELLGAVKQITDGLAERDEYAVATAFASVSDREEQKKLLRLTAEVLRDCIISRNGGNFLESAYKDGAKKLAHTADNVGLVSAIETINEHIEKTLYNPNVKLAAAVYSATIYEAVNGERIK